MVVLTEKETAAVVSNIPNNLANGNGNANTLTNGSDDHGIGAELSSTEAQKPFQMKRKLPDDSQFTTDGDPKNQKTEDGSRPLGKKPCNQNGNHEVIAEKDVKQENGDIIGEDPVEIHGDVEEKTDTKVDEKEKRKIDAAKIRAMLMLEETNLLLLKKLKASQTPKPVPSLPATAAAASSTAAATGSNNSVVSEPAAGPNVNSSAPGLVKQLPKTHVPSVQSNVVSSVQNHGSANHQTSVQLQQQQRLLEQLQRSDQMKMVVNQQNQMAKQQHRATAIPTAANPPVPSVNTNIQQRNNMSAQIPNNVPNVTKGTTANALPPNVVPSGLFRGPPPAVTPGTTSNTVPTHRNSVQQQPTVRVDPAAAAKREQAAKLALKKQLEKTLLQIPPPRPPPANLDFLVWPTIEFLYLTGLEETVENVLVNTLMKPSSEKKKDGKKKLPLQCAQCQTDFTTAWKRDLDSGKVICEQCLVNNNKKAVKKEHTNRLKLAVEQALQQEKEVIQKLKEEERKQTLASQQAAAVRAQQQQQQQQQHLTHNQPSNSVSAVAQTIANQNGTNLLYGQHSKQHPPLFINPTLGAAPAVSSANVNARPTVHHTQQHSAPKGRILNPAPGGGRILNPAPGGMRKY